MVWLSLRLKYSVLKKVSKISAKSSSSRRKSCIVYFIENILLIFSFFFSDWNNYLKTYLNTNLENNRKKLLETLNDCLQPKDGNPDNRPDCCELLKKINEFSVDKSLLIEDNTYAEFQTVLEKQNVFLKIFFDYKINEQDQTKREELPNINDLPNSDIVELDENTSSEEPLPSPYGVGYVNEETVDIRKKYKLEKRMAIFLKILKSESKVEPELLDHFCKQSAVPQLRPYFMNSKFLRTLRFGFKIIFIH